MKWYYHVAGGHTHVRVFMNGAKCGDLCFRNEEFQQLTNSAQPEDHADIICDFERLGRRTQITCYNEAKVA